MTKTERHNFTRVCQGDIIRDVSCIEHVKEAEGILSVSRIEFPLVVVLTQDCELEQEFRMRTEGAQSQDKWLVSVLVAPMYNAQHVYRGEQLSQMGLVMQQINQARTHGRLLRNNEIPRYHYMEFPSDVPIVPSVIDFKHYFSVNAQELANTKSSSFVCMVSPLFREDISHRFASYLSRIGLPEPNAVGAG